MDADLDTLCTVVYCTADDLLPEARRNARRRVSDAEVVTLCVAQAIMGIPSDRRFLADGPQAPRPSVPATAQPGRLSQTPPPSGRRDRVAHGASSPAEARASHDDLLLCDSTPVPCAASRETAKRSALGEAAGYGYCAAHSRWYWGFRLHLLAAPDGTPRAFTLADPAAANVRWPSSCCDARRAAVKSFCATRATPGATSLAGPPSAACSWCDPARKDETAAGPYLAPIRQRIESIFWTAKDLLTLERHGARTMAGLRERILQRFCCLAVCISLNHRLGRPSRALVDYCA